MENYTTSTGQVLEMENYKTGVGQDLLVHNKGDCKGVFCVIHNPSPHSMREFPTNWRQDRALMERICPHGIGHPDPDDLAFKKTFMKASRYHAEATHGCCGICCVGAYGDEQENKTGRIYKAS